MSCSVNIYIFLLWYITHRKKNPCRMMGVTKVVWRKCAWLATPLRGLQKPRIKNTALFLKILQQYCVNRCKLYKELIFSFIEKRYEKRRPKLKPMSITAFHSLPGALTDSATVLLVETGLFCTTIFIFLHRKQTLQSLTKIPYLKSGWNSASKMDNSLGHFTMVVIPTSSYKDFFYGVGGE